MGDMSLDFEDVDVDTVVEGEQEEDGEETKDENKAIKDSENDAPKAPSTEPNPPPQAADGAEEINPFAGLKKKKKKKKKKGASLTYKLFILDSDLISSVYSHIYISILKVSVLMYVSSNLV